MTYVKHTSRVITIIYVHVLSHFGRVQLFVTPWTLAHQAPLSMGLSRQEYWSGLPCPPPGALPHPGMEARSVESPALQADSLPAELLGSPMSITIITKITVCLPVELQETGADEYKWHPMINYALTPLRALANIPLISSVLETPLKLYLHH